MVPLSQSRSAHEREIIEGFERPIRCHFCGKEINKLSGKEQYNLAIHSLDGNHENWDPSNKVPAHQGCHSSYHSTGEKHPQWRGGEEAARIRARGDRRHRLYGEEIREVMEGLVLLLTEYVKVGEDLERATLAFRPFYRMLYHRTGRPNYPEPTTWNTIVEALEWYHLSGVG